MSKQVFDDMVENCPGTRLGPRMLSKLGSANSPFGYLGTVSLRNCRVMRHHNVQPAVVHVVDKLNGDQCILGWDIWKNVPKINGQLQSMKKDIEEEAEP